MQTVNITTKNGNTLQLFYNPDNDLLVVDLIDKSEKGGIEIVRKTLDERKLLAHVKKSNIYENHSLP